jgi:AraC-like DNA-binding protein
VGNGEQPPSAWARGFVSVQVLRALLGFVAGRDGLDVTALAASLGVPLALLDDPDGRVPLPLMVQVWETLPGRCGDDNLGLNLAEAVHPGAITVVGYLVCTAPTVGEGWRRALRYERLVQEATHTYIEHTPDALRLVQRNDDPSLETPRHAAEFGFAAGLLYARRASGQPIVPRAVRFAHRAPSDDSAHRRVFGVAPRFGCGETVIEFDPAVADLPHLTADPALFRMLEAQADTLLQRHAPAPGFVPAVVCEIESLLPGGDCALPRVARALGLSRRTLQRRLADAGVTLHGLTDDARRRVALRLLGDDRTPIAAVALATGFSEASAFHRAFVRWTGESPGAWRRRGATG